MEQILVSSVLFPPQNGGIQTVAYEISRAIQSLEKEVIVLAPDYKGSEIFDSGKNMDIVRNKYLNKKYIGIFAFIYLTLK